MISREHPVVIDAIAASPRSRFMFSMPELYGPLIEYAVDCLKEVFPSHRISVVTNQEHLMVFADLLGLPASFQESEDKASLPGIVVKPHNGPLSPSRIRYVLAAHKKDRRPVYSSMLVHPNCNPAWLHCIDGDRVGDGIGSIKEDKQIVAVSACCNGEGKELTPKGSQWLTEAYYPDKAVVASLYGTNGNPLCPVQDDPNKYADMPMFYQFPLFWMHEVTWPEMSACGSVFKEMLSHQKQTGLADCGTRFSLKTEECVDA